VSDEAVRCWWVPMRDPATGVRWKYHARAPTAEEAREKALDKYERRHDYRPEPAGEPEEAEVTRP